MRQTRRRWRWHENWMSMRILHSIQPLSIKTHTHQIHFWRYHYSCGNLSFIIFMLLGKNVCLVEFNDSGKFSYKTHSKNMKGEGLGESRPTIVISFSTFRFFIVKLQANLSDFIDLSRYDWIRFFYDGLDNDFDKSMGTNSIHRHRRTVNVLSFLHNIIPYLET